MKSKLFDFNMKKTLTKKTLCKLLQLSNTMENNNNNKEIINSQLNLCFSSPTDMMQCNAVAASHNKARIMTTTKRITNNRNSFNFCLQIHRNSSEGQSMQLLFAQKETKRIESRKKNKTSNKSTAIFVKL